MRKQPKSFTVEVKRRPSSLTKKPALVEPAAPAPQPPAAAAVFSAPESAGAAADPRRILPCLVTEAALDAARTQLTQANTAPLSSVRDLIDGYVVLYESREAAQPGQGMASRARAWREKRVALREMAPGNVAQLMAEH